MKNFFFKGRCSILCGLVIVASCNESKEMSRPFFGEDSEIRFGSNGIRVESKSFVEATNSLLQANGFKAAVVVDSDNSVMFNAAVAYDGNDDVYRVPDEHYYYPSEGTVSIYGVYPSSELISVSSGEATVSYVQNPDEDLVGAKAVAVARQSTPVLMEFEHLLSQVTVSVKTDSPNVVCKLFGITLTDADGGVYSFADENWSLGGTVGDYVFFSSQDGQSITTNTSEVGEAMSFIPGTILLNVKWKCYNKTGGELVSDNDRTVGVELVKGKHSILNLTLPSNSSELSLVTSVGEWITEEQGVIIGPDITYSVNIAAGGTVTLPSFNITEGTAGHINWGDGTKEPFNYEPAKSVINDNKITFSHTYTSDFTGDVEIYIYKGKLSGEFPGEEMSKFNVKNEEKADLKEKVISFTVNDSGKKVIFAPGNLYWDGAEFHFEEHQYDYPTTWDEGHIGSFYFSKDSSVSVALKYNDKNRSADDAIFAADGGAVEGWTVLSAAEWIYLCTHSIASHIIFPDSISYTSYVNGVKGSVFVPDGSSSPENYDLSIEDWELLEKEGYVFLPWDTLYHCGSYTASADGGYWTSERGGSSSSALYIDLKTKETFRAGDSQGDGYPIRLVKVVL